MLTDAKVRGARPAGKPYALTENGGLILHVTPSGTKSWRWRRQVSGKAILTVLGRYPAMSLSQARRARDDLRERAAEPAQPVREVHKLKDVAARWHATQKPLWKPHHAADVWASLQTEIWPTLGDRAIDEISAAEVLATLQPIERRGAVELGHRLRQRLSAVWTYALVQGIVTTNPAGMLSKALTPIVQRGHRAAVVSLDHARDILVRVDAVPAYPITRLALRMLALTAVRPGELRGAEWAEVDFASKVWTVPAARMKHTERQAANMRDHVVPLPPQAIEVLEAARVFSGRGRLIFPSSADATATLSENAVGYLMNRAGFAGRQTAHGWRATFSSVMNERRPGDRAIIDIMLAHVPKDSVEAAYNRAQHMARRREIAEEWANMLMQGMPEASKLAELRRK